jgi:hypothetical protein
MQLTCEGLKLKEVLNKHSYSALGYVNASYVISAIRTVHGDSAATPVRIRDLFTLK